MNQDYGCRFCESPEFAGVFRYAILGNSRFLKKFARTLSINLPDKHESEISFGGVVIPRSAERGCSYFHENKEEMDVFFVSREIKDQLIALHPETTTSIVSKVFVNDVQEKAFSYSIILLDFGNLMIWALPSFW